VYEYAFLNGIPHQSCMIYTAKNLEKQGNCEPIDICRDCSPPSPPADEDGLENCYAIDEYKKYHVSDHYSLKGVSQMKAEIYKNGPISCGIDATRGLDEYTGGIYREEKRFGYINHEISLVGWGLDKETGTEYWIGRNSWGTYWGERGFFRIQMYKDNLLVEEDCSAGIPSWENVSEKDVIFTA